MSLDLASRASALEAEILELKKDNARLEKDIQTLREAIGEHPTFGGNVLTDHQDERTKEYPPLAKISRTPPSRKEDESKGYRFDGAWT
jgi:hypothetical protein